MICRHKRGRDDRESQRREECACIEGRMRKKRGKSVLTFYRTGSLLDSLVKTTDLCPSVRLPQSTNSLYLFVSQHRINHKPCQKINLQITCLVQLNWRQFHQPQSSCPLIDSHPPFQRPMHHPLLAMHVLTRQPIPRMPIAIAVMK